MIRQFEFDGARILLAVEPLAAALQASELAALHPAERALAEGIVSERRRRQLYCGRLLLRSLLKVWLKRDDLGAVWCDRVERAPRLVGLDPPAPAVSLSHCQDHVAAAIGMPDLDLGVDVESRQPRDPTAIARRFNWPVSDDPTVFQQAWVLWEAAVKARLDEPHALVRSVLDPAAPVPAAFAWTAPVGAGAQVAVVARRVGDNLSDDSRLSVKYPG